MDANILNELNLLLEKDPIDIDDSNDNVEGGDTDIDANVDDKKNPSDPFDEPESLDSDPSGDPILLYNEKVQQIKKIKYQRIDPEPGFDFSSYSRFYSENYIGISKHNSMIIGSPKLTDIEEYNTSEFFKNVVVKKVYKNASDIVESGRKIVYMGDYGLPVFEHLFQNNEQGLIAKLLLDDFNNNISLDT